MGFQQRMRSRQQMGWENFMSGTKHSSGCYNVKTVRGFHCDRPPISERFQAWKELRGEGELPSHVLILQDNKGWILENEHKQKNKQILFRQQQQLQQLTKLLLPQQNKEEIDTDSDTKRHRRHRRRRRHRRHRRETQKEQNEEETRSRSRSRDSPRSRSRSMSSR